MRPVRRGGGILGSLRAFGRLVVAALRGDTEDVARGPLSRAIPLLAIPMALETAMEALFTLLDVVFLARVGPEAVATAGLTESLLALVYAGAFGLGMPATAMVARRVGEGDAEGAARAGAQAILLGGALGSLIGLSGFAATPLLAAMGADDGVLNEGRWYAAISLGTSPLIILLFIQNAVLRGAGDAMGALRALWLANAINLVLDPCLIFGLGPFPELGVTGAAVATAIGRASGVLYQVRALRRGPRVSLRGRLSLRWDLARALIGRSWGGAMQHLVETGSWVVLTRIVAEYGSVALSGYTIAMRVLIFTLLPAWGFSNATATLVGQSLGAGQPARAERAVWLSGLYAMVFLMLQAAPLVLLPELVVGWVAAEPEVIPRASEMVFIVGLGYAFYGWQMVAQQAFNGAGDTRTPALINAACFWGVQVPLAYLLARLYGVNGVPAAAALSYSVAALVSVGLVRRGRWKRVVV